MMTIVKLETISSGVGYKKNGSERVECSLQMIWKDSCWRSVSVIAMQQDPTFVRAVFVAQAET